MAKFTFSGLKKPDDPIFKECLIVSRPRPTPSNKSENRQFKIGLDIHGVIDLYPDFFSKASYQWKKNGHEIHILTGKEWKYCEDKLKDYDIQYDTHYSIVDYHLSIGTKMWNNDERSKGWWMERDIWVRSKGAYAYRTGINVAFDDSPEYFKYFPENCLCIYVPKIGFVETFNETMKLS